MVELVGRFDARAGRALLFAAVGVLVAGLAIQLLKKAGGWGTLAILAAAALIGAGGAVAYARWAAARTFVSYLTPAPLVVLVLFLVVSPVHRLVFTTDIATAGIRNFDDCREYFWAGADAVSLGSATWLRSMPLYALGPLEGLRIRRLISRVERYKVPARTAVRAMSTT